MELPAFASAALIILSVIALAVASYAIMRKLLAHSDDPDRRELAGSVIFRVSALHGLILALVFAQEVVNLRDVTTTTSREAALVGDVFYDLSRYDAEQTKPIRENLASYTRHVLETEWQSLGKEQKLHGPAWADWDAAYGAILDLSPSSPRQEALKTIMLQNIREISSLRRTREDAARSGINILFVSAAVIGVVLTAAAYFTFQPTILNLFLLSIFAFYSGLIIFFIIAFSNPYLAPGKAEPIGFELLYEGEIRALGQSIR